MPRNAEALMKRAPNAVNTTQPPNAKAKPINVQAAKESTRPGIMIAPTELAQSKT